MKAPVRFAYGNARLRALAGELWDGDQRARVGAAPALYGVAITGDLARLYPSIVRWYSTLLRACRPAVPSLTALLRRHEIENLKLLWRAATRKRPLPASCWRPLGALAALQPSLSSVSIVGLVEALQATPYARTATETWRSHGSDLAAAELAFDGWISAQLREAASTLPKRDRAARDLLFDVIRERDLDLLARGRGTYGLEPEFVVGLTTLLKREVRGTVLLALAAWQPTDGPIARLMPSSLLLDPRAQDWSDVRRVMQTRRARLCRRALIGYPFQTAPTIAAVLLREDQLHFVAGMAGRLHLRGAA